jgi:hypothetical protein
MRSKHWVRAVLSPAQTHSATPQREQDFAAVGQALQSGDLAGAQQAFAALESTFHRQSPAANAANSNGPAFIVNLGILDPGPAPSGGPTNGGPPAGSGSSTASSTPGPEIVVNLGILDPGPAPSGGPTNGGPPTGSGSSSGSGTSGPEIVINLGANPGGPEQLTIGVNNTGNNAEQISISLGTPQNPTSQDQITLNLNANSHEQIVLNLLNSSASSPSPSGLSVVA